MMNFPERHVVAPLTEKLYQKADMEKIPLNGTFELSPVCNFSCRMCYVRKTQKEVAMHDRKMVTLEQWIQIGKEARDDVCCICFLQAASHSCGLISGNCMMHCTKWDCYCR